MGNIGAPEIILLLLVALLLFGAKRLPEIGRSLGSGMREFKDSVSGVTKPEPTETTTTTQLPAGTQDTNTTAPSRENEHVG
ncbi:MAG TPA: twin-arginine translocase TatA/TatE family subunit [Gaiellaceae bacterium]|nr:twin-arginine translocase TatA/TatE family subunit [Gaiellaceae bacterium]